MPQFNGKQGAVFRSARIASRPRSSANLRCPRNGKRMGAARRPAPSSQATGAARQRRRREGDGVDPPARIPANTVVAFAQPCRPSAGGEAGPGHRSHWFFNMASTKLFPRAGVPLAIAFLTPAAFAQVSLPEVAVSASRTEQRVQDALPSTTVLTRQDIEAAQTPDLPTLLQRVAGLEITQVGGPGTVATASLRGAEARHTLVLVDGVPINNLNFGLPALEHLSLADVERIEVVRGNVSSLYGSAALGGVIQIITRQPTATPTASVTVQGGSRGLVQGSATGAVRLASGTGLRATVEALRDRGFDATNHVELPGTDPDRDGYRRRTASLGVTQDIEGGHSIGLRVRESRGTTEYDSQFGPATQADASRFVESSAVIDGRMKLSSTLGLTAAVTRATDKLDAQVTAFPFFVQSTSDGAQLGLQWQPTVGQT